MNTKSIIEIFRGDDSDALGYQTIVGTIHTDLDLTGCKAVFRYLGFFQEFDPIPEDGKLTIVIPSASSMQFPPGFGYASLKVYDIDRKVRTFTNRIPVFVKTMTPCRGGGEFDVEFSPFPELEPLKIFIGPNADDFDQYTGFLTKTIDRASAQKYGLSMLFDAMDAEKTAEGGCAASPAAIKAAYDAIIGVLADNYYTAEQTDEAIDRVAAYYITYDAAGNPFPTYAALANAQTVYSGGSVRVPTRNDYCVVLADETHQGAEYRYIYAVAEGQTTGSWQPQFPVEGVMTVDQTVIKDSVNPVAGGGVWSAIWGALAALPTGFSSIYDWCVSQLAGKLSLSGGTMDNSAEITWSNQFLGSATYSISRAGIKSRSELPSSNWTKPWADIAETSKTVPTSRKVNGNALSSDVTLTGADIPVDATQGAQKINAALSGKLDKSGGTVTGDLDIGPNSNYSAKFESDPSGVVTLTFYDSIGNTLVIGGGKLFYKRYDWQAGVELFFPSTDGTLALTAGTGHAGNLAALDANGNPTDAGWTAGDIARYALTTKTINNGAVTLDDRAINAVAVSSSLASLTVNFPTATSGKARDFGLRLTVASGVTTAPQIVLPQGVVCENADGEAPEIGADGAATILYFTETASGVFLVKGEVVTAIS